MQFDVKAVDIGEFLEQNRLTLHHWFGRQRPDITQAQNGGTVGHDGHQIAARGIVAGGVGVGLDLETCFGNAGGIGAGQITPVCQWFGGPDLQFSGLGIAVIVKGSLPLAFAVNIAGRFGHCGLSIG